MMAASVGKGLCYRVDIDNICRHCWTWQSQCSSHYYCAYKRL